MKLRYLRSYIQALRPNVNPIIGPGSRNQFYQKPIDKLQYFDENSQEWKDVPVVELDKPKAAP